MEIIDNINKTLKNDMIATLRSGSKVAVAASCFSIYAFQELKEQLSDISELRFKDDARLAVYHDKQFVSPWQSIDTVTAAITGFNLDAVWQNIVSTIGTFEVSQENTPSEQIHTDEGCVVGVAFSQPYSEGDSYDDLGYGIGMPITVLDNIIAEQHTIAPKFCEWPE